MAPRARRSWRFRNNPQIKLASEQARLIKKNYAKRHAGQAWRKPPEPPWTFCYGVILNACPSPTPIRVSLLPNRRRRAGFSRRSRFSLPDTSPPGLPSASSPSNVGACLNSLPMRARWPTRSNVRRHGPDFCSAAFSGERLRVSDGRPELGALRARPVPAGAGLYSPSRGSPEPLAALPVTIPRAAVMLAWRALRGREAMDGSGSRSSLTNAPGSRRSEACGSRSMDVLRSLAAGVGEADKRGMSLKSDIWKFRRNVAYPIGVSRHRQLEGRPWERQKARSPVGRLADIQAGASRSGTPHWLPKVRPESRITEATEAEQHHRPSREFGRPGCPAGWRICRGG